MLLYDGFMGALYPDPFRGRLILTLDVYKRQNIDSFTSLEIDGIRIVDESVLIRFFSDNGQYVKIWSGSKIYKKEKIWENSQPTIDDFKRYKMCIRDSHKVVVRRILNGNFKAPQTFGFTDAYASRQLGKGYILRIVQFNIGKKPLHPLYGLIVVFSFRQIQMP